MAAAPVRLASKRSGLQFFSDVPLGRMLFQNDTRTEDEATSGNFRVIFEDPAQRPSEARSSSPERPRRRAAGAWGQEPPSTWFRTAFALTEVADEPLKEGCGRSLPIKAPDFYRAQVGRVRRSRASDEVQVS